MNEWAQVDGSLKDGSLDLIRAMDKGATFWLNDAYFVTVGRRPDRTVFVLRVQRTDNKPVHSWADLQAIKNEFAGLDVEAIELFPAQARLMDIETVTGCGAALLVKYSRPGFRLMWWHGSGRPKQGAP